MDSTMTIAVTTTMTTIASCAAAMAVCLVIVATCQILGVLAAFDGMRRGREHAANVMRAVALQKELVGTLGKDMQSALAGFGVPPEMAAPCQCDRCRMMRAGVT